MINTLYIDNQCFFTLTIATIHRSSYEAFDQNKEKKAS